MKKTLLITLLVVPSLCFGDLQEMRDKFRERCQAIPACKTFQDKVDEVVMKWKASQAGDEGDKFTFQSEANNSQEPIAVLPKEVMEETFHEVVNNMTEDEAEEILEAMPKDSYEVEENMIDEYSVITATSADFMPNIRPAIITATSVVLMYAIILYIDPALPAYMSPSTQVSLGVTIGASMGFLLLIFLSNNSAS